MMKTILLVLLVLSRPVLFAQKNFSVGVGADFSFATKGLGLNDAGFGFHLQANLLSKYAVQFHFESGLDYFAGDKLLAIDLSGTVYERNPTIKRVFAGPEFCPAKRISVAALYGVVWNNWLNNTKVEDGLKFLLSGQFGKRKRFIPSLSFTVFPGSSTHYFTTAFGYTFLK